MAKKTKKQPVWEGVEFEMTLARETKGTYRYESDEEDAPVTTLYVRKSAFESAAAPDTITLTITPAE